MAPDAPSAVALSTLRVGTEAALRGTRLDEDTRDLLRALGLTDDSRLRVCKSGEPFIIQVRSTRIGVSGAVASRIDVVPTAGAPDA